MIVHTAKGVERLLKKDNEARKAAVARGIRNGARYGRAMLVRKTPVDQGQAKAAWKTHTTGKMTGEIASNHNTAPHIGIIEKGARPHKVSLSGQRALYEWVERHFVIAGGIVLSQRDLGEGIKSTSLRATKSRAHKVQRTNYLDRLSKLGRILEDNLIRNYPDMGRKLVPAALNITASIIQKIKLRGQKPTLFVQGLLPELTAATKAEVEKEVAKIKIDIQSSKGRSKVKV